LENIELEENKEEIVNENENNMNTMIITLNRKIIRIMITKNNKMK
jgi:hypothetical protein